MSAQKTLVSIVGARPQFIKLAPICRAFAAVVPEWRHVIIHTGQHYDYGMSEVFFDELGIPKADSDLNVGSGSHGAQTAAMLSALETEFERLIPDCVIVYGDTNSTLAAALAASKQHFFLAHVEAGLRSFNRLMPEEINRIVADHCSDILFAPTAEGMRNLEAEGLGPRAILVGDVMYDAVLHNRQLAENCRSVASEFGLPSDGYAVVTLHRPVNTDAASLHSLICVLDELARSRIPLIWPMHPRTRAVFEKSGLSSGPALHIVEPVSYLEMLLLVENARLVLTDSGGLQKEAAYLGTPCVTLREETEWIETIEIGANTLAGSNPERIRSAFAEALSKSKRFWVDELERHYGNGDASTKIVMHLVELLNE